MLGFLNKTTNVAYNIISGAVAPFTEYCDGFGSPGASGNNYILGFYLGAGSSHLDLRHDGSRVLDEINSFDRAEIYNGSIGQINMSIVSSFCGPSGLIWGYDIVPHHKLRTLHELNVEPVTDYKYNKIPVYSGAPLLDATSKLFGSVTSKRFPLLPGSHVPCAGKNFKDVGPRRIYATFGVGIAKDRRGNACLLMEDMGWIPLREDEFSQKRYKKMILQNVAQSIVEVGKNQRVEYSEIFTEIVDIKVNEGEVGCALVASPYFTLARNAIPNNDISKLLSFDLATWEKSIEKNFLGKT